MEVVKEHRFSVPAMEEKNAAYSQKLNADRVKVLFVIDTLEMGGAEQSLLENVSRFRDIEAIVCHIYEGDALKNLFLNAGVRVHSISIKKKYAFISAYRKLSALIKKEQPNLIIAYLTRSELVSRIAGKLSGIPVIGTFVSDLYDKSYNYSLSLKAKIGVGFFKGINRLTSGFCEGFIANSETIKISNSAYLKVPLDKIEVINRGRDSKIFTFQPPPMFSNFPIRFLNIGRLVAVKGQVYLLAGFKIFLQHCPGAILHIAGSGPEYDNLMKLIRQYQLQNNVVLLGTRNNINHLLHSYDCFVLPSLSEGFSGTLLEAMFSGIPILASDIPSNQELIQHMKSGYLFQTASAEAVCHAMLWFKDNRYAAYLHTLTGHENAVKKYDQQIIAGKFENYLIKKISGRS